MNPCRCLEQWLGSPRPLLPFLFSMCFRKEGRGRASLVGPRFFSFFLFGGKSRVYEDNFLGWRKRAPSSWRLRLPAPQTAQGPLGRVRGDFNVRFPGRQFFCFFVVVFLFLICGVLLWPVTCIVLFCMRRGRKKRNGCCPVQSFNLDFIFVPKWCCLFCLFFASWIWMRCPRMFKGKGRGRCLALIHWTNPPVLKKKFK